MSFIILNCRIIYVDISLLQNIIIPLPILSSCETQVSSRCTCKVHFFTFPLILIHRKYKEKHSENAAPKLPRPPNTSYEVSEASGTRQDHSRASTQDFSGFCCLNKCTQDQLIDPRTDFPSTILFPRNQSEIPPKPNKSTR